MRRTVAACIVCSALAFLPGRASAIIVLGGTVMANATDTTVDLYNFTFTASGTLDVGLAEENDTPPIGHPAIDLYSVAGNTATLAAAASATQAGNVELSAAVDPGSYIMAVSEAPLTPGNFGPLNAASTDKVGYSFEFGITGALQNDVTVGCAYAGNLNGTFSLISSPVGLGCSTAPVLPTYQPSAVPEPVSAAILAVGLSLTLASVVRHRRWL